MGDAAIWTGSGVTAAALVTSLGQLGFDRRRRHRDEAAATQERRLSQAQLISVWLGEEAPDPHRPSERRTPFHLINTSNEPVYGLVVSVVFIQGAGPHRMEDMLELTLDRSGERPFTTCGVLPPGRWRLWIEGGGHTSILSGRGGAEVAFTDRAGVHWIRRTTGPLEEIPQAPTTYFERNGLFGPYDWVKVERDS